MKIEISGHHVDITESVKNDIEAKFHKIAKHYPSLISINVIISKQHNEHHVELSTNYEDKLLSARCNDEIMYPAIASAIKKLDAALSHRKGVLKANLRKEQAISAEQLAHEKIQEMSLN